MKKFFAYPSLRSEADIILLIARVFVGFAFTQYGWMKIQTPMTWMGADASVPGIFQFLAAFSEFGGGIALILGLLTRLASLGIAITMCVAVYFHAVLSGDPFVSSTGGPAYVTAASYLVYALIFIVIGPGRYSLDRAIFGAK